MTFTQNAVAGLALILLLAWSTTAHASYDYKFCVEFHLTFDDNGYGEDTWTSDTYRPARGALITVEHYDSCNGTGTPSEVFFSNEPLDDAGCTPEFRTQENDCFRIAVRSEGVVGNNNQVVSMNYYPFVGTVVDPSYNPPPLVGDAHPSVQ